MSHIMFGLVDSCNFNTDKSYVIEQNGDINDGIYFLTGSDIPNLNTILTMFSENNIQTENHCIFMLSSELQPHNSDDLLFPYSKYENDELFISPNNFEDKSKENLHTTFCAIEKILRKFKTHKILLAITESYDNNFIYNECSMKDAETDILRQVLDGYYIESAFYSIQDISS